ncbi:MAG: TMEM175 family protein [Actinobacteria bacterium]|nr:TMEM175 family protein [Actinomycetota bacterium]
MAQETAPPEGWTFAAERPKAFVDAVVAIALTLLILPLMESVGEVAGSGDTALSWLDEHRGQLVSFVLSFVLIALFWMLHHRLFSNVHHISPVLLWLLAAWMLTIVWLPVATAIAGQMPDDDVLARMIYIGSLTMTALVSLVVRAYLHRHPSLHTISDRDSTRGFAVDASLVVLFLLALGLTVLMPQLGYYALLITALSGVVQKLLLRIFGHADRSRERDPVQGRPGGSRP